MKIVLVLFLLLAVLYVLYEVVRIHRALAVVREVANVEHRFEKKSSDTTTSLLVLGDSTGEGVGANKPEDTVASLFGAYLGATYVENNAVSGAIISDLASQIERATLPRYSVILVQIGGNEIIRFRDAHAAAKELEPLLHTLKEKTDALYVMSAGNVGGTRIFPYIVRPLYHALSQNHHRAFEAVSKKTGATYINLYDHPRVDPFVLEPERFLADGLHPSSEGYALCFEKVKKAVPPPKEVLSAP